MHDLRAGQSILHCPDMNLVDSWFHNFLQILNILVIKSSYKRNNIMLQSFYPLVVYPLANGITSSICTALGLANHEPKKTNAIAIQGHPQNQFHSHKLIMNTPSLKESFGHSINTERKRIMFCSQEKEIFVGVTFAN